MTHWEDGLAAPTIAAGLAAVAQNGQRIYFLCFQSGRQAGIGVGVRVGVGVGIRTQALAAAAATFCPGSRVPRPALCWDHHEALGHVGVGTPGAAMTAGCEGLPVLTVGLGERGGAGAGHEVGAGQEEAEAGAGRGRTGAVGVGMDG